MTGKARFGFQSVRFKREIFLLDAKDNIQTLSFLITAALLSPNCAFCCGSFPPIYVSQFINPFSAPVELSVRIVEQKHQLLSCSRFPVTCGQCGELGIVREDITRHCNPLTGTCPMTVVSCQFVSFGCTFQVRILDINWLHVRAVKAAWRNHTSIMSLYRVICTRYLRMRNGLDTSIGPA